MVLGADQKVPISRCHCDPKASGEAISLILLRLLQSFLLRNDRKIHFLDSPKKNDVPDNNSKFISGSLYFINVKDRLRKI